MQNVIPKELNNKMGTTITGLGIELKMIISRVKYLESRKEKCKNYFSEGEDMNHSKEKI